MSIGIILAGGKGTRMNSQLINKVVTSFVNKPLIKYGVELFENLVDKTIVVVGANAESVKSTLHDDNLYYVHQSEQLGTGHAVQEVYRDLAKNADQYDEAYIGYGDHMMFYTKEVVKSLRELFISHGASIALISSRVENIHEYRFGRILRDANGYVIAIREDKNATEEEKEIHEFNAGFYLFDNKFLEENIFHLEKNELTHEFYLTDLIEMAANQGKKVVALEVPFHQVGIGINTPEELRASEEFYKANS